MPRRRAAMALHGVILAGLVAGPLAYVAADRTVTLSVDGRSHQVSTYASTVGDLLRDESVAVGPHDVVAPGMTAHLSDGLHVSVLHGRPVHLLVDGRAQDVWTTAMTVDELTRQLRGRLADAYLSASRSTRIPVGGLWLDARLPKSVTLTLAGTPMLLVTTAATWSEVLVQAGVVLGPLDVVSMPVRAAVVDGQDVVVTRVATRLVTHDSVVPFAVRTVPDPGAYVGARRVVVSGRSGLVRTTWRFTMHDGHSVQRRLVARHVVRTAVARVVAVGTRKWPAPVVRRTSAAGLNWSALARCESGGNPRAVGGGGTYLGLYQFSLSAWQAVGGAGSPVDASSAEQTYRAQLLYLRSGAGVWPYCGHLLLT